MRTLTQTLVTPTAFLGCIVTAVFGLLASLSAEAIALPCFTVAAMCAICFVIDLSE